MQNLYTCTAVQNLIGRYIDKGGESVTIQEGTLGYGKMILFGEGLKTAIIEEVSLNEWSSGHKVRFYNKTPAKYLQYIGG